MQGYRPDWIGFVVVAVTLSISSITAAAVARKKGKGKLVVIIGVVVGSALAVVVRTVLHHFGI